MRDILKIRTYAVKKLVSIALSRMLSKKLGCTVKIWMDDLDITNAEGEDAHIAFSGKATVPFDKITII